MKMFVFLASDTPIVVVKAKTMKDAKKQMSEAFHDPSEASKFEVKELTMELLDELTNRPEFTECDNEFMIVPGGDF